MALCHVERRVCELPAVIPPVDRGALLHRAVGQHASGADDGGIVEQSLKVAELRGDAHRAVR